MPRTPSTLSLFLLCSAAALLALGALHLYPAIANRTGLTFLIAAVSGGVLARVIRDKAPVIATLEHEAAHLVGSLLVGRRPRALVAEEGSGHYISEGYRPSTITRLAPYVAPIPAAMIALILLPVLTSRTRIVGAGIVAILWGASLHRVYRDIHPGQTDLQRGGLARAYLAIGVSAPVLFGAVAILAIGGPPLVWRWLRSSAAIVVAVLPLR